MSVQGEGAFNCRIRYSIIIEVLSLLPCAVATWNLGFLAVARYFLPIIHSSTHHPARLQLKRVSVQPEHLILPVRAADFRFCYSQLNAPSPYTLLVYIL